MRFIHDNYAMEMHNRRQIDVITVTRIACDDCGVKMIVCNSNFHCFWQQLYTTSDWGSLCARIELFEKVLSYFWLWGLKIALTIIVLLAD